jgi:prepilin-type N-terminal cleavage/methylation domain-containing protein
MKQRGFTLIEMMVVFVIIVTVGMIGLGAVSGSNNSISMGINGMTESRCIEGYKFIVSQDGSARQILDEFGKGARCEIKSKPGSF